MFLRIRFLSTFLFLASSMEALAAEKGQTPIATVTTTMGTFRIELFEREAPVTVKNFIRYVRDKFYDGTIFHRVVPGFIIQGGGLTESMEEKPVSGAITNEASTSLRNLRGTVAMARAQDPNSATSQFFVNLVDNAFFDKGPGNPGYAVFGKVIEEKSGPKDEPRGMAVVDRIAREKTATMGSHEYVPLKPVVVKSIAMD